MFNFKWTVLKAQTHATCKFDKFATLSKIIMNCRDVWKNEKLANNFQLNNMILEFWESSWVLSMLRESKACWEMQSPGPLDEVWQMMEKLESVERVTSDFCKRPHDYKQNHALLILNLTEHSTPREKRNRRREKCARSFTDSSKERDDQVPPATLLWFLWESFLLCDIHWPVWCCLWWTRPWISERTLGPQSQSQMSEQCLQRWEDLYTQLKWNIEL